MKVADLKKKFKNTWVLAEVLKEDKLNRPVEVRLVETGEDRDSLYDALIKLPKKEKIGKTFTTIYTGKQTLGAMLY